jgi:adenosine deaminase CECR1
LKLQSLLKQSAVVMLFSLTQLAAHAESEFGQQFEKIKLAASDEELYQLLYEMPKGGDLHSHSSGSGYSEWWYEQALAASKQGYVYHTRIKTNNCRDYGHQAYKGAAPYYLMFYTITSASLASLPTCEQAEFKPLAELDAKERAAWENSIRLDKPYEGRDEFFQTHWQRLGDLDANPYVTAEIVYLNLKAFGDEGLLYLEPQLTLQGYQRPDGSTFSPREAASIITGRLSRQDALDTGMTWRFQEAILRFLPNAEESLETTYKIVAENEDWVAVNMVGREDDDKGHPLRFLETLRKLRQQYHGVKLSIHAGEVDEPNFHIRDTLLLGADRIGHGVNLINDPETLREMRHGPYLVEVNLISNLLLEYVDDYSQHPFPEYLRIGVPVALSTDDRGMWDSTLTDEFYVAVREFNLSWTEIKLLSRNSISFAFLPEDVKNELLATYDKRIAGFERRISRKGVAALNKKSAPKRGFICTRYELCGI